MKTKWLPGLLVCILIVSSLAAACAPTPTPTPTGPATATPTPTPTPAKPMVWTFATPLPEGHAIAQTSRAWLEKIEEETNGRITFEYYWAGALMGPTESYEEVARGVCDVGNPFRSMSPISWPLGSAMRTFFVSIPTDESGNKAVMSIYNQLRQKFPEIDAENDLINWLGYIRVTPFQLQSTKPVRRLEDFQGLTINCPGGWEDFLKALGADVTNMPTGDLYMALEKGTVDGCLMSHEGLKAHAHAEVVDYVTLLNLNDNIKPCDGANWDSWNSLPADIKKVFEDNVDWFYLDLCRSFAESDQAGIDYAEECGVEFIELTLEDQAKLYELFKETELATAAELDAMGLPGTEMTQEAYRLVAEYTK